MDIYETLINELGRTRVKTNEPLALHTTIKIGGPADLYFEALSPDELKSAVLLARKHQIPFFILGGGSNLLVSDKGYRGLIIRNKADKIRLIGMRGTINNLTGKSLQKALLEAQSGAMINQLVRFALDEGLSGLEYFLGQPGTVGGAVWINAKNARQKTYIGDRLKQAEILTPDNKTETVLPAYFRFGYDESVIQKTRDIVLSVIFELEPGQKDMLWEKAAAESAYRKDTQPALPSYGCTFRNISQADAMRLATPNYTMSAGYLIDQCGLKGKNIGNAGISDKHANFILNLGGAKANDVVQLIKLGKEKVKEKFGVNLKEEVVYLGDF